MKESLTDKQICAWATESAIPLLVNSHLKFEIDV